MFEFAFIFIIFVYFWNPFRVFADLFPHPNVSDDQTSKVYSPTRAKDNNGDNQCGGWGKRLGSMEEYENIKQKCYLTIRNGELCCIDLPDCPKGMVTEIPLKPYHMFPIKKLKIGCKYYSEKKKKETSQKSKSTCVIKKPKGEKKEMAEENELDFFAEMDATVCIDCFVYCIFIYICVREIKRKNTWEDVS